MAVTPDDVLHVAKLARIAVAQDKLLVLASELSSILGHMEELDKVKTDDVSPAEGVGAGRTPLRRDAGPAAPLAAGVEAFAPETRDGFIIVPRLASHEGAAERSP